MTYRTFTLLIPLALMGMLTAGCQSGDTRSPEALPEPLSLDEPELFVDFDQNGLVMPAYIDLLPDGRLAIVDFKKKEMLIYNKDGSNDMRFGGEGKGPGEFVQPRYFSASSHSINVVDFELHRINRFDAEGNFRNSHHFEANPYDGTVTMLDDKRYVAPAAGKNNSLIMLVDTETDSTRYFGEAMGEYIGFTDLDTQNKILASGEIPPIFKNEVTLYPDGKHLYVFLNAYGRVRKYTTDGELVWEKTVDPPVRSAIFERTVERAKKAPEAAVPVLRYLSDFKVAGGQIYLFWNPAENHPRTLQKLDSEGNILAVYHIPEEETTYNGLAVDPETNTLYLSAVQHGQIYRTVLPGQ